MRAPHFQVGGQDRQVRLAAEKDLDQQGIARLRYLRRRGQPALGNHP
ncbi:MAG: hypothetical protein ACOYU7_08810 [Bacillota bacterium]